MTESVVGTLDQESQEALLEAQEAYAEESDAVASNIVKNHIIASMTLGLVPVPLFDLAALVTTQMNMLRSLGYYYDIPDADTDTKSLVTSLIAGSLPVLGVVGLSSLTKLIPGVGTLVGSASLSLSAGAVTYAVGNTFIMHFEAGGTLEDFEPKQAQAFFKQELGKGKQFVKEVRAEMKGPVSDAEPVTSSESEKPDAEKKDAAH